MWLAGQNQILFYPYYNYCTSLLIKHKIKKYTRIKARVTLQFTNTHQLYIKTPLQMFPSQHRFKELYIKYKHATVNKLSKFNIFVWTQLSNNDKYQWTII